MRDADVPDAGRRVLGLEEAAVTAVQERLDDGFVRVCRLVGSLGRTLSVRVADVMDGEGRLVGVVHLHDLMRSGVV